MTAAAAVELAMQPPFQPPPAAAAAAALVCHGCIRALQCSLFPVLSLLVCFMQSEAFSLPSLLVCFSYVDRIADGVHLSDGQRDSDLHEHRHAIWDWYQYRHCDCVSDVNR